MSPKRRIAVQLRNQGKSYSQIKDRLGVSKSTLSRWLREYPLSREQLRALRDFSEVRIEKFRKTMQAKREQRLLVYYEKEKGRLLPFSRSELHVAGLFLYWGEGSKANRYEVNVSNADPAVIRFAILWMTKCVHIPREEVKVRLYLYEGMSIERETKYWSAQIGMPKSQFVKPQVVRGRARFVDRVRSGHGTCCVYVYDTRRKEQILMALRAIADHY